MQIIYPCPWTVEEYITLEGDRQIVPESTCPNCGQAVHLHRHARYQRWLANFLAKYVLVWIARFLCPLCRRTVSYLPDFAFSYRPLQPETLQAYLEGQAERPDVRTFRDQLRGYVRRAEAFSAELFRGVGAGLGRLPRGVGAGSGPGFWKRVKGCAPSPAGWQRTFGSHSLSVTTATNRPGPERSGSVRGDGLDPALKSHPPQRYYWPSRGGGDNGAHEHHHRCPRR